MQSYSKCEICHPCSSEKAKYILLMWSACFYFTCDEEHVIRDFHNSYGSFPDLKRKKKSTDATLMMIQQTSFMFAREITVTSMWWVQQQIKPQIRDAKPQSYRNCIENSGPYQQENFPKACNAVLDPNSGVQLHSAIEFQAYHYWKGFNRKKLPASSQLFTINFSGMLHKITKLSLLPVTYKSLY